MFPAVGEAVARSPNLTMNPIARKDLEYPHGCRIPKTRASRLDLA